MTPNETIKELISAAEKLLLSRYGGVKKKMTGRKSIKIRTEPETEFDVAFWAWARAWWQLKIDAIPKGVRQDRRAISYLCRTTGMQQDTLRRLLKILKLSAS
jgi:hypothetical protein